MKAYRKLFLGLMLILAAVLICTCGYIPSRKEYLQEEALLEGRMNVLQQEVIENRRYRGAMDRISAAREAVAEDRSELYDSLPTKMGEEEQLLYAAELEKLFDRKISLGFGQKEELAVLSDGAVLTELNLTLRFAEIDFKEFWSIVKLLEQNYPQTVSSVELKYDPETGCSNGAVTITRYFIEDEPKES